MSAYFATQIDGVEFRWRGGEYIESGYVATERGTYEIEYGHAVGEFVAQECINVWDYGTSAPFIERTLEGFEAHCVDYMATQEEVWAAAADSWEPQERQTAAQRHGPAMCGFVAFVGTQTTPTGGARGS